MVVGRTSRYIMLVPLLWSIVVTLGHAAEEAPQGVQDEAEGKPDERINGTVVKAWHDEEFKEFLRTGSMNKAEKSSHLMRVANKHFAAWQKEQKRANASEAGALFMMQASQAFGEAFNVHDTHLDLMTDEVASRLYLMLQHTGPTFGNVQTMQGHQAVVELQMSLQMMIARVAEVATAMVYEPNVSDAQRQEYYTLGRKWLMTLMVWHFNSSSSKWRLFKKQLLNSHMLPEDFKRPDIEHSTVGKLTDIDIEDLGKVGGGDTATEAVQRAVRARQEADDRMDRVSGEAQKEASKDKMAASQERAELR